MFDLWRKLTFLLFLECTRPEREAIVLQTAGVDTLEIRVCGDSQKARVKSRKVWKVPIIKRMRIIFKKIIGACIGETS